ncbi:hypothetical protein V5O48_016353 [Marasmius crinis-equi]|uniref:Uncharacterized protein n=1 Tax=Marasmius crinis-equi TaxID=585013 RepID=A0ABR3ERY4_9AGAR
MARGRKRNSENDPTETDVIFHPVNNTVACRVCNHGRETLEYYKRENWKNHIKSATHIRALASQQQREHEARQTALRFSALYNAPAVPLQSAPSLSLRREPVPSTAPHAPLDLYSLVDQPLDFPEDQLDAFYPALPSAEEREARHEAIIEREFERLQEEVFEQEVLESDELNVRVDEADVIAQDLRDCGLVDDEEEVIAENLYGGVLANHNWYPYPNKTTCLLDVLDNLPRLRFSDAQMKMVLWVLEQTDARDVPTFYQLRKLQQGIRDRCSVKTEESTSDLGNIFSTVDIRGYAARHFANPMVAPLINLYPHDVTSDNQPISEMWHILDGRWTEIPQDMLPPSILVGRKRHYIHELAETLAGVWVIPQVFVVVAQQVHVEALVANRQLENGQIVVCVNPDNWTRIPASALQNSHNELVARYGSIHFHESSVAYASKIPNVNRLIDNGEDLFTDNWSLWSDDVSGGVSKQYQKHINIYGQNANLPGRLLQQQFFVNFLSTSPHATSLEQFKPIIKSIKSTHQNPIQTYNAHTSRPCGIRIVIPDLPADNPSQAEQASHIGHQGLQKCRSCQPGGAGHGFFKAIAGTYKSFYEIGNPRNVVEIRSCILEQLRLATFGVAARIEELQSKTGAKDKIAQHWIDILLKKAIEQQDANPFRCEEEISNELLTWLGEQTDQPYNPLLDVPCMRHFHSLAFLCINHSQVLDPSQDTLVEILHTILLGVEKYAWHNLHSNFDTPQQKLFALRLQSTEVRGLSIPPIRAEYMMQYRNALIGKHFKTLIQTATFHLRGITTDAQYILVRALGELGAVLWMAEIDDMEVYLQDLTILIDNVLDAFADIDPSRILTKIKLHMLVHLPSHIRRRGPAVRFSTEIFEAYNAVFRLCSVLSNHQAASRDISRKMADMDRIKHILTGGYWQNAEDQWVAAGPDVRSLLSSMPILQRHLGWTPPRASTDSDVGMVRAEAPRKNPQTGRSEGREVLSPAIAGFALCDNPTGLELLNCCEWVRGSRVFSVTGDECEIGSWIICSYSEQNEQGTEAVIGRIARIYLPAAFAPSGQGVVVVERFVIGERRHFRLQMPVLTRHPLKQTIILPSTSVQFEFNVQHDCEYAQCSPSQSVSMLQERQQAPAKKTVIVHQTQDEPRFIINTHAFHNARLLRKFLPRHLYAPVHLFPDRQQRLHNLDSEIVVTQGEKRAETNRKAAETRARNKALKAARQVQATTSFEPEIRM